MGVKLGLLYYDYGSIDSVPGRGWGEVSAEITWGPGPTLLHMLLSFSVQSVDSTN
jgi:hypothetical protein